MSQRSLRVRLFIGAAVWIMLALLVAGTVIGFLFVRNAERTARTEMSHTLSRENGGEKVDHGSGGIVLLRAA